MGQSLENFKWGDIVHILGFPGGDEVMEILYVGDSVSTSTFRRLSWKVEELPDTCKLRLYTGVWYATWPLHWREQIERQRAQAVRDNAMKDIEPGRTKTALEELWDNL
jgi:hypothetical protein